MSGRAIYTHNFTQVTQTEAPPGWSEDVEQVYAAMSASGKQHGSSEMKGISKAKSFHEAHLETDQNSLYLFNSDQTESVHSSGSVGSQVATAKGKGLNRSGRGTMMRSKSVTFFPGVSVRECLHINNFTDEEVANSWYKKQDFTRIKKSFLYIIQQLSNGTWEGDTEHESARGLEYRTRDGANKRKVNKLNGLVAVLDEQDNQWLRGVDDAEAIATAYREVSSKSIYAVRLLAAQDEKEVMEMWANDVDFVAQKLVAVEVGSSGKRSSVVLEQDERKKKLRLKQFMKGIQIAQRLSKSHQL